MNTNTFRSVSIACILLVTACASAPIRSAEPEAETFYRVVVTGDAGTDSLNRLKQFHQEVPAALAPADLGTKDIGCDNCDLLNTLPPKQSLTFALYRNNKKGMNAFMHSYLAVQAKMGHDTFEMYIDGVQPAGAGCPVPRRPRRAGRERSAFRPAIATRLSR